MHGLLLFYNNSEGVRFFRGFTGTITHSWLTNQSARFDLVIIADFRRPEGPPNGAPYPYGKHKNPWVDFLMSTMASGIARGCVRTKTTTESRNMAAIIQNTRSLGLQCTFLYWTSMLRSVDICQNKVSADPYHVTIPRAQGVSPSRSRVFLSWPLTKCWFSIGSRAYIRLTCWKQGRIARKLVNANPGLTFSSMQMFFVALFCLLIKTQNSRPNNIQKTSPQSFKIFQFTCKVTKITQELWQLAS